MPVFSIAGTAFKDSLFSLNEIVIFRVLNIKFQSSICLFSFHAFIQINFNFNKASVLYNRVEFSFDRIIKINL